MGGWDYCEPLVPQFANDHDAFHEDAKPGDLSLQFPIRWLLVVIVLPRSSGC